MIGRISIIMMISFLFHDHEERNMCDRIWNNNENTDVRVLMIMCRCSSEKHVDRILGI